MIDFLQEAVSEGLHEREIGLFGETEERGPFEPFELLLDSQYKLIEFLLQVVLPSFELSTLRLYRSYVEIHVAPLGLQLQLLSH